MRCPKTAALAACLALALPTALLQAGEPKDSADPNAPALESQAVQRAVAVARRFFAEDDQAKRREIAEGFVDVAPESPEALSQVLRRAAERPDIGFGVHTFHTKRTGIVPAVRYVLSVPEGYAHDAPEGWPLVIGLHGTGGKPENHLHALAGWLGPDLGRVLIACPEAPIGGQFVFSEIAATYPRAVLDDVRRRVNVDSDRVILAGYSKGGYATWAAALTSPGDWGGAVPMAAFPLTDAGRYGIEMYMPNVLGLAVQYHWGSKDILPGQTEGISTFGRRAADVLERVRAERFEAIEYRGQGHMLEVDTKRFRQFVLGARREPWPERFKMLFHHLWEGRGPNVRATVLGREELDFSKPPPVRVTDPSQVEGAVERLFRQRAFEMTVAVNPKTNLVNVLARNLREVEVLLSPQQLDFSRPIRIRARGRTVETYRDGIDWVELLETARRTHDFDKLVGARVRVTVGR